MGMQEAAEVLQYCFSDALAPPGSGDDAAAEAAGGEADADPAAPAEPTEEFGREGWTQLQSAGGPALSLSHPNMLAGNICGLVPSC